MISPSLRFAAACSYLPSGSNAFARQGEILNASLKTRLSPDACWYQIRRHRIYVLAQEILKRHERLSVLGEHAATLTARSQKVRSQSLMVAAETQRLESVLSNAGITHHILKGPRLAQKLYADSGMRHSRDIDVIIHPDQLLAALALFRSHGWQWPNSDLWFSSKAYLKLAKSQFWHVPLVHPRFRLTIEAHWRFEHIRNPVAETKWWTHWDSKSELVTSAEALHLVLHGSNHAWSRMKWLGDLRTLIDRQPRIWAYSLPLASELGLSSALAQAILLLERLYEVEPDSTGSHLIAHHSEAEYLARFAISSLAGEASDGKWSTRQHLSLLRYGHCLNHRHGIQARFSELLSVCLLRPYDLVNWRLPLFFLFSLPILRWTGFIRRRWTFFDKLPQSRM